MRVRPETSDVVMPDWKTGPLERSMRMPQMPKDFMTS